MLQFLTLLATTPSAHADSFLTSVELVRSDATPLPAAGPCTAELQALGSNVNAFDHAALIGACHGYDSNSAVVESVRQWTATTGNPVGALDLAFVLVYQATYSEPADARKLGGAGASAVRTALKKRPADARVWLVGALVLAQEDLFIEGGSWDKPHAASKEVVGMVRRAVALNRSAPSADFQPSLDAAVDYMVMYSVYAELGSERSQADLPRTTGTGD